MFRPSSFLWLLPLLPACSSLPGLEDPGIRVQPQLGLIELNGVARMQSPLGPSVTDNPNIDVENFGAGDSDEEVGGAIHYGDGFSGFEFGYFRYDQDSTQTGTLPAGFGTLTAGTEVRSAFELDEYRIGYSAALIDRLFETEDDDISLQWGVGLSWVHRIGDFRARAVSSSAAQRFEFRDNTVPYLTTRLRLGYRGFAIRADYAVNPDVNFGGDFDSFMQDMELRGSYAIEDQDLELFVSLRRNEIPMRGTADGFQYDTDFRLEGVLFGLDFSF